MHELRANKASSLSANVLNKTKKIKRVKRTYNICSVFYFTIIKNTTTSMKQNNKMSFLKNFVSKKFRIEIQIFQQNQEQHQYQKTSAKKKEF